jgi:hypothetical protein
MMDWKSLAGDALWILGCALALGGFSYFSWQASTSGEKLRNRLKKPGAQFVFSLAGLLVCTGLALVSDSILTVGLWGALAILFLVLIVAFYRQTTLPLN